MTECQFREPANDWRLHLVIGFAIGLIAMLKNSWSIEFSCLLLRQITLSAPKGPMNIRGDPFFLQPPFFLNHTAFFFSVAAFPSHFHIKLLSCSPLTSANSTSIDDRKWFPKHSGNATSCHATNSFLLQKLTDTFSRKLCLFPELWFIPV